MKDYTNMSNSGANSDIAGSTDQREIIEIPDLSAGQNFGNFQYPPQSQETRNDQSETHDSFKGMKSMNETNEYQTSETNIQQQQHSINHQIENLSITGNQMLALQQQDILQYQEPTPPQIDLDFNDSTNQNNSSNNMHLMIDAMAASSTQIEGIRMDDSYINNQNILDSHDDDQIDEFDLDLIAKKSASNAQYNFLNNTFNMDSINDFSFNNSKSFINNENNNSSYGQLNKNFKLGGSSTLAQTPLQTPTQQYTSNFLEEKRISLASQTHAPSYTLNIVVRQFTKFAERKLNLCLNNFPLNKEPNIVEILSEGVDPNFDRVISSLGYIARKTPKRVTDAVMHWRRGKSELREMARSMLEKNMSNYQNYLNSKGNRSTSHHLHQKSLSRSNFSYDNHSNSKDATLRNLEDQLHKSEVTFTQADRQFTISTFILWRVLIEVIKQTPPSTLTEDTGLEEIMYNYLRSIDPYLVSQSLIHSANWNLLSELIGQMSEKSFLSVSDRFICDLEKFPTGFTNAKPFSEASLNLLIYGMRYLQFSNASLERFEEGADFIKSLAKFFYKCENENLFLSYCDVINQLLLSLAGTLTAEVNHPTWLEAVKVIYSKAIKIATSNSNKYWGNAITLAVTVLSVAPKEMFENKWRSIVDSISKRLKPKTSASEKLIVITCVTRLTWAYLFRYQDTLNSKTRTMENLANLLFLNIQKKQQWLTEDAFLIQTAVQFFRSLAYSQLNYTLENIFIPFLKSSFNHFNFEIISYEKIILCIRAYCWILSDYQNEERPPYPTDDIIQNSLDPLEFSNTSVDDVFEHNSSNAQVHEEISSIFIKVLFSLESQCGCKILDSNLSLGPTTPSSATSTSSLHQRISSLSYFHTTEDTSYKSSELFTTVITSITWCANPSNVAHYRKIVELLVKNCIHENETTAQFCIDALKILICKKNPGVILTTFSSIAFCLDEKTSNSVDNEYLSSDNYVKLLDYYLEVLQSWLDSLSETEEQETEEKANTMYNVNRNFVQEEIRETKKFELLELKNMATLIDEVEGNALLFLFSHDFRIRFLGCQILRMITQFDDVIYYLSSEDNDVTKGHNRLPSKFAAESGTRIIEVLGSLNFVELTKKKKSQFSEAELKRYAKFIKNEKKSSIVKLAESNHGVDAAIWFKIFEDVLDILVKTCPIQIAIARSHSCIRLVQFYDQIVRINNEKSTGKDNAIIWDYMLYLKIACASLTSTNEQRVHIPDLKSNTQTNAPSIYAPLVRNHSRKKSQQLFTVQHQKITSAKSIFKMTVPLLTTSNIRLRDALVEGLSCMNVNIFKTFIQSIESSIERWEDSSKGTFSTDISLKQEICCILSNVIYKISKTNKDYMDDYILEVITRLLSNLLNTLLMRNVQINYKFQRMRKYFCNILETVHTVLMESNSAEKWLDFNFRNRSFQFMVEWSGYGDKTPIFLDRYSLMRKAISVENDLLNLEASLEIQKHQLQLSAISCISCLCKSPVSYKDQLFDLGTIFSWLDSLFKTYNEKISGLGRSALLGILCVNGNIKEIFELIVKKCYTHDSALGNYFITLTDALVQNVEFEYEVYLPLSLALFSSGSDNYNVRSSAALLLEFTENKFYNTNNVANYVDGVCCRSRIIYKRTIFQLSTYFATSHPEEKFRMISELTLLFNLVGSGPRRDLIAVLLPWIQTVDLDLTSEKDRANYLVVLSNFFDITMKYSHKIQNELEALWVALGTDSTGDGVKTIFDFIISNSLSLKNLAFVECSRQVIVSISTIPSMNFNLIDSLLTNLEPKSMIPSEPEVNLNLISEIEKQNFPELPYVAKLSKLIQKNSSTTIPTFSLCELSIIYLADLILIPNDKVREKLPLLLNLSIVLLDHQLFVVQDQAAALIIHLIHEYGDATSEVGQRIIRSLRNSDHSNKLWDYDDLTNNKTNGRKPDSMDTLIRDLLIIFESKIPTIQNDWSKMSIYWATTCKVMHVASRSFQVFRCLISFLDQSMLKDMLLCLTNTISDNSSGIQEFSMQILMTLNAITSELYSEQLIAFPQLFWSSVASLTTVHENEFIEVLSTLSKFISKIDFNSVDTVNCLAATFPSKWEGKFEGLQKMIMIGLRSSNAYEPTLKIMSKLNLLDNSQIIGDGKHRVLLTLLANMPRFLHAHVTKRFNEDIINVGNCLIEMSNKNEIIGLSRIIESLIKKKFRNKEDFLNQIVNLLKRYFFPKFEFETITFLLGLLFNNIGWIKIETMDLLKHIFRVIDLNNEEFNELGADLISPLLRLLLTEYSEQALEVLDEVKILKSSPFDKHYLMMSVGDNSLRKEYDKISTLFGIPDESGWSIPMPSIRTAITRNNVHSVYLTCIMELNKIDNVEKIENDNDNDNKNENENENKVDNEENGDNEIVKGLNNNNNNEEEINANSTTKEISFESPEFVSQYVQYNPLSPELQKQVNLHHQKQERLINDNISINEKDSLSDMLATLETLDSFFTKDIESDGISKGKIINKNEQRTPQRHQYSSSIDTKSTTNTDKSGWNYDFDNTMNMNLNMNIINGNNLFDSNESFRTLLADVKSPNSNEILLSPRIKRDKFYNHGRVNSFGGELSKLRNKNSENSMNISLSSGSVNNNNGMNVNNKSFEEKGKYGKHIKHIEPLKISRDISINSRKDNNNKEEDDLIDKINISIKKKDISNKNTPIIMNNGDNLKNDDNEDIDKVFGFELIKQTNNKSRRSSRFSTNFHNEGNLLLQNSPISPRYPRSPRNSNNSYNYNYYNHNSYNGGGNGGGNNTYKGKFRFRKNHSEKELSEGE